VRQPGRPKSEKRQGGANLHSMPEDRVCNGSQNQWFLGKNWSPMVVTVEKQVYGGPWTKGDNTCGLKVLSGAPEVIRTPGLLIRSSKYYIYQ
jgi:hypothetical protein